MDNLKVGDIVYCYKDHIFIDYVYSKKGEYYKINDINIYDDDSISIGLHNNDNKLRFVYYILKPYNQYDYIQNHNVDLFYDYFMTLEQYRKLKLEKIHERILNGTF